MGLLAQGFFLCNQRLVPGLLGLITGLPILSFRQGLFSLLQQGLGRLYLDRRKGTCANLKRGLDGLAGIAHFLHRRHGTGRQHQ